MAVDFNASAIAGNSGLVWGLRYYCSRWVHCGLPSSSAAATESQEDQLRIANCFLEACGYSCGSDGGGTFWQEQRRYKLCEHSGH